MFTQKLYSKKKIDFRIPGVLIHYMLSPFYHNLHDKMHTLMGSMTILLIGRSVVLSILKAIIGPLLPYSRARVSQTVFIPVIIE